MRFEPAPTNDFLEFMHAYHERSRQRLGCIRAVAAKWAYEDLIPGLSDFDTRFIVRDGMKIDDWHEFSLAVGEVHREMAERFPRWHRNLEHLPGINLTVSEFLDQRLDYPEFRQWTFYAGEDQTIAHMQRHMDREGWSARDEAYHLGKVATFFGPYQRGIDPPVNLGPWENKYPLHSRLMHWFAPPMQAMVSLKQKRTVRGKFESLRQARDLFPHPEVIDRLFEIVEAHYEEPRLYEDPMLGELEGRLECYLHDAWNSLASTMQLVQPASEETRQSLQAKVAALPADPLQQFFTGTRFSRQMKGRLRFYAAAAPGFETDFLIRNELGRILANLYDKPMRAYARAHWDVEPCPHDVLDALTDDLVTPDQAAGMKRFVAIASQPIPRGEERRCAAEAADAYDPVLGVLEAMGTRLLEPEPVLEPMSMTNTLG